MWFYFFPFFRCLKVKTPLVREGGEYFHTRDEEFDREFHTLVFVYTEMYLQIVRDYSSLPDPRTLTLHEIKFYYDALRPELHARTKPKG